MNAAGQEFSAFRLLIEAILVMLILAIIISILGWVDAQRFVISEKRLYDGFFKAVNSPDGRTVVEKDVTLKKGSIYTVGAFASPGIPKNCIGFDALRLASLELSNNNQQVAIKEHVQLDMFYRCEKFSDECSTDCEMCCKISFGKEFQQSGEE